MGDTRDLKSLAIGAYEFESRSGYKQLNNITMKRKDPCDNTCNIDFCNFHRLGKSYTNYLIYSYIVDNTKVESELLNRLEERYELLRRTSDLLYKSYAENKGFLRALERELEDVCRGIRVEKAAIRISVLRKFIPEEYEFYK